MKMLTTNYIKEQRLEIKTKKLLEEIKKLPLELDTIYGTFIKTKTDIANVQSTIQDKEDAIFLHYQGTKCFEYLIGNILEGEDFDENSKILVYLKVKGSLKIDTDDYLIRMIKWSFVGEPIINATLDETLEEQQFEILLLVVKFHHVVPSQKQYLETHLVKS